MYFECLNDIYKKKKTYIGWAGNTAAEKCPCYNLKAWTHHFGGNLKQNQKKKHSLINVISIYSRKSIIKVNNTQIVRYKSSPIIHPEPNNRCHFSIPKNISTRSRGHKAIPLMRFAFFCGFFCMNGSIRIFNWVVFFRWWENQTITRMIWATSDDQTGEFLSKCVQRMTRRNGSNKSVHRPHIADFRNDLRE